MRKHGATSNNEITQKLSMKDQALDQLLAEKEAREWELREVRQQMRALAEQLSAKEAEIIQLVRMRHDLGGHTDMTGCGEVTSVVFLGLLHMYGVFTAHRTVSLIAMSPRNQHCIEVLSIETVCICAGTATTSC